MAKRNRLVLASRLCLIIALPYPSLSYALEWNTGARLPVSLGYTDNARLVGNGQDKTSDWYTAIRPGFSVYGASPRLQLNADYSYSYEQHHDEHSSSGGNHSLTASANSILYENWLSLATTAGISQVRQNSQDFVGFTRRNLSDSRFWTVTPTLHHRFSGDIDLQASVATTNTNSSGSAANNDGRSTATNVSLTSGRLLSKVLLTGSLSENSTDYKGSGTDTRDQKGSLQMSWLMSPELTPYGVWGYDKLHDDGVPDAPRQSYWSAGLNWTPSTRTALGASFGHRFFGNTGSFFMQQRSRSTSMRLSYSRDMTTSRADLLVPFLASTRSTLDSLYKNSIPDDAARAAFVDNYLRTNNLPENFVALLPVQSTRRFLDTSYRADMAYSGARTSVNLGLFWRDTDSGKISLADVNASLGAAEHTRQHGYTLDWSLRLGPKGSVGAGVGTTTSRFVHTGNDSRSNYYRTGVSYTMGRHVIGSAELRRAEQKNSQDEQERVENSALLTLTATF